MTASAPVGSDAQSTLATVERAAAAAGRLGRPDLEARLRIAAARMSRPATVVCVVGEFKQGKSSLVNALLGQNVCPTDDDLATSAHTFVRYADRPTVLIHRRVDGKAAVEEVPPATLPQYVTERGNPGDQKHVERVEIGVPNPLLAGGLVLVDMPGVGGLAAGQAAATLAFLPFSDGLIFVSDASAELSSPEREFLGAAIERSPAVVMALTKTDIAGNWRRIAGLDRGHLDAMGEQGKGVEILPVAAPVRRVAIARNDQEIDAASGYPALLSVLIRQIVRPAKQLAAARGRAEAVGVLDQLDSSNRAELDLLEHPERFERALAELAEAQARLEHLRGPGARWSTLLNDRIGDLSSTASYSFRGGMRTISRSMDEAVDVIKTPAQWDELGDGLQRDVADAVGKVFGDLERGIADLRRDIAETLREEVGVSGSVATSGVVDVASLWAGAQIADEGRLMNRAAAQSVAGLRGAQSGLTLFSLVGQFAPRGATAFLLATPLTLGIGLAFAGQQLVEANRRKIAMRRQRAKTAARQFIDDVQFEVTNELSEAIRERQRQIRDEFSERVGEALRTNTETATRSREDAQRAAADRTERTAQLARWAEELQAIRAALAGSAEAT
jgi:hypothetical protein